MPLDLTIVTPSGSAFRGEVDSVVLPGSEGDFGVLPEHERFLCPLRVGELQIQRGGQTTYAAVSEGFAEARCEPALPAPAAARGELLVLGFAQALAAVFSGKPLHGLRVHRAPPSSVRTTFPVFCPVST